MKVGAGVEGAAEYEGLLEGLEEGVPVGFDVGLPVGVKEGVPVGIDVGLPVGVEVGVPVGVDVGLPVGVDDGLLVGVEVGERVVVLTPASLLVKLDKNSLSTLPQNSCSKPIFSLPCGTVRPRLWLWPWTASGRQSR